jgi:hypothetical protein
MGRPRKTPPEVKEAISLAPCARCDLRLPAGPGPTGVMAHDCKEVQRLRRAASKRAATVPLEQRLREELESRLEQIDAKELAQVLVTIERQKQQTKGTGPSDALQALLVN